MLIVLTDTKQMQAFPNDFDGIIAGAPASDYAALQVINPLVR
jgi:hypothetical protein